MRRQIFSAERYTTAIETLAAFAVPALAVLVFAAQFKVLEPAVLPRKIFARTRPRIAAAFRLAVPFTVAQTPVPEFRLKFSKIALRPGRSNIAGLVPALPL